MILHIPHASTVIPTDLREQFLLSDADLSKELLLMTDAFTDALFQADEVGGIVVQFPVSRLVVDAERFEDDEQEIMASRGMGVIFKSGPHVLVCIAQDDFHDVR